MDAAQELVERLRTLAEEFSELSALTLFGSRARGTARPDSDLDVAILTPSREPLDRWRLQGQLAARLEELVPGQRVDVVFLDEAPELLRQRVFEHGRLVLCRDESAWKALRVTTMKEHADREPARRLFQEAQRRRLAGGLPDGRSPRALESLRRAGLLRD